MQKATIDVVIPTYKPDASFREMLRILSVQTQPVSHILIINTGEEYWDDTLTEDVTRAEVFHIRKEEFDHAGARNMGAGFSDADYLLFMTQDALPADRYLVKNLLACFSEPCVKAAYARQLPRKDAKITEGIVRSFNYPAESCIRTFADLGTAGIKAYFCSNVCAMYERATFQQMGGFLPPAIFNEDMVYAARIEHLGYGVAYAAKALVYHSHNYTNMQQFRRNFDNGVSQAMHPEIFRGVSSTGEGRRMVKYVTGQLKSVGRLYLLPRFYWQCFVKLAGFRLGRIYKLLPKGLVRKCSASPEFFDRL